MSSETVKGTLKSELLAREGGETFKVGLGYTLTPVYVDDYPAAVGDTFKEWLLPGHNVPDGDYTRGFHSIQREKRVHVKNGTMGNGWLRA